MLISSVLSLQFSWFSTFCFLTTLITNSGHYQALFLLYPWVGIIKKFSQWIQLIFCNNTSTTVHIDVTLWKKLFKEIYDSVGAIKNVSLWMKLLDLTFLLKQSVLFSMHVKKCKLWCKNQKCSTHIFVLKLNSLLLWCMKHVSNWYQLWIVIKLKRFS